MRKAESGIAREILERILELKNKSFFELIALEYSRNPPLEVILELSYLTKSNTSADSEKFHLLSLDLTKKLKAEILKLLYFKLMIFLTLPWL